MFPGLAHVSGHTLMPSRRPAESRPFAEEPPAFFVAMPRQFPPNAVTNRSVRDVQFCPATTLRTFMFFEKPVSIRGNEMVCKQEDTAHTDRHEATVK
jgi:hypothetical protein